MGLHLAEIAAAVAPGAHAVLLVDQAGWHLSSKLMVPPNITIVPLPPRCPELNPVENLWQFMRDNWLSNRIFQSGEDSLARTSSATAVKPGTSSSTSPGTSCPSACAIGRIGSNYRDLVSGQPGFFDTDERLRSLSAAGMAPCSCSACWCCKRSTRCPTIKPSISCATASFMRFAGLGLHDQVPDATTIWLYREHLTRAGALARAFERFDGVLRERGYLAMGGQIVDATVVEARRRWLSKDERATLREGGTPADWSKARTRRIDRDGRWTIRRGRKKAPPPGSTQRAMGEIATPLFGYKNHLGIDRAHGFIRRFTVTHAARHDGSPIRCRTQRRSGSTASI